MAAATPARPNGHVAVWRARVALAAFVPADRRADAAAALRELPAARRSEAAAAVLRLAEALLELARETGPLNALTAAPAAELLELAVELDAWRTDATAEAACAFGELFLAVREHDMYALRRLDAWNAARPSDAAAVERGKRVQRHCVEPLTQRASHLAKEGGSGFKKELVTSAGGRASLSPDSPQKGNVAWAPSMDAIRDMPSGSPSRRSITDLRDDVDALLRAKPTDSALNAALQLDDVFVFARVGSQNMKLHYAAGGAWPEKLRRVEDHAKERRWTVVCLQEVPEDSGALSRHFPPRFGQAETTGCPWLSGSGRSPWVHCHATVCDGVGRVGCGGKAEGMSFFYDSTAWTRLTDGVGAFTAAAAAARPLCYPNPPGCVRTDAMEEVDEVPEGGGEGGGRGSASRLHGANSRFARAPALIVLRSTEQRGPPGVLAVVGVHLRFSPRETAATEAEVRALGKVVEWATTTARKLAGADERVVVLVVGDFNLPPSNPAFDAADAGLLRPPALQGGAYTNLASIVGAERTGGARDGKEYDNAWLSAAVAAAGAGGSESGAAGAWLDVAGEVVVDKEIAAFVTARDSVGPAIAPALERAVALGSGRVADLLRSMRRALDDHARDMKTRYSDHLAIEATLVVKESGANEGGVKEGDSGGWFMRLLNAAWT